MGVVTATLCAIMAALSFWLAKKEKKKYLSLLTIFYVIWLLVSLFSSFQLYGLEKPSIQASLLIFIMVASFTVGAIIGKIIKKPKQRKKNEDKYLEPNVLFYAICVTSIVLGLIDSVFVVKEAIGGTPLWQIRNWTHEPFGASNPILDHMTFFGYAVRKIIVEPASLIIPAIAAYYVFHGDKNNNKKTKLILALSIVNLVLEVVKGAGGRLGILLYATIFLISFLASGIKNFNKNKKRKRMVIVVIIASLGAIAIATIARTGFGNLFKQFYTYFALPTTLLSKWLPVINESEHTFGLLTLNGIFGYPFKIISSIGLITLVPNSYYLARVYLLEAEKYLFVGSGNYNAFVTPIYYFMHDGGIVFVVLASIVFGLLVSRFEERKGEETARYFCNYSLVLYGIIVSFMRIQTVIPNYIIAFILVFLIFLAPRQKTERKSYGKE